MTDKSPYTDKNENPTPLENNSSSNAASNILLAIWYIFLSIAAIALLGFVALFVVCMV